MLVLDEWMGGVNRLKESVENLRDVQRKANDKIGVANKTQQLCLIERR